VTTHDDRILVVIPCYGCAPQIGRVLAQFDAATSRYFAEILVLDNGSRDGTIEAATAALPRAHVGRVTVARNRENYNLGGSHKAAFAYAASAGFSHVVVLHGDDQGDIRDILPLLAAGKHREHDACLGARFMRDSRLIGYSRFRIFGNRVFNALFRLGAGAPVLDLGSGLNIFSRRLFDDPAHIRNADDLRFNVYLLLRAIDQRQRLLFFPISWREDDQISNVRMFSQAWKTLGILGRFLFDRAGFRATDHRTRRHEEYRFEIIATKPAAQGHAMGSSS
jgi:glycosyltransferase involved in cell wall biosynthesis